MFFESPEKALLKAVLTHNTKKIEKLIKQKNIDINIQIHQEFGPSTTALILAVNNGFYEVVKMLLENGADANQTNRYKETPLNIAIVKNRFDMVELLLNHGANTNLTPKDVDYRVPENPLILASTKGNQNIVQLLLDKGANVNYKDGVKDTALIIACRANHPFIIRTLLDHKRKFNLDDHDVTAALYYAKEKKSALNIYILEHYLEEKAVRLAREAKINIWQKISDDEIAHITSLPGRDRTLTDIFNFTTRERITLSENKQTKAEAISAPQSFDAVNVELIEEALKNFKRHGGNACEDHIFRRIKKSFKK